jgi:hypothetical protein
MVRSKLMGRMGILEQQSQNRYDEPAQRVAALEARISD